MNILITGGASGLGEIITRTISRNPKNKVYFTFKSSKRSSLKIESDFPNSKSIYCDFENIKSVNSLCDKIEKLNIDTLINNAYTGKPIYGYFHKVLKKNFEGDFLNNIIPTIIITQTAIKKFRKLKKGKIITVLTSFLAGSPPIGSSVYVANKAYLKSLSKSWASENKNYNITSNTISPSFMLTNFTSDVDERIIEQKIKSHPLKKILTTYEVAEIISYMITASDHLNGQDILINAAEF